MIWTRTAALAATFAALLAAVQHAAADTVTLTTGETLRGRVAAGADGSYTLEHPLLGTLQLPAQSVADVQFDGEVGEPADTPDADTPVATVTPTAVPPSPDAAEDAEEVPDVRPGLFGTGFMEGWSRSISFGLTGSEGSTEELDLTAGFAAGYEDDHDRWALELAYLLGTESGDRTDHEFYASIQKDWLVPESRWFYFAEGRYDWDEFENWDHRISAGGGVGYAFLDRDDLWLRTRAGLGVSKDFGSEDDDIVPEGILGATFGWRPTDNQEITASTTFYPALDDLFEFRNISAAAWKIAIDQDYGLSLKLGLENEYDSTDEDDEPNDLTYFAAIVYDF